MTTPPRQGTLHLSLHPTPHTPHLPAPFPPDTEACPLSTQASLRMPKSILVPATAQVAKEYPWGAGEGTSRNQSHLRDFRCSGCLFFTLNPPSNLRDHTIIPHLLLSERVSPSRGFIALGKANRSQLTMCSSSIVEEVT